MQKCSDSDMSTFFQFRSSAKIPAKVNFNQELLIKYSKTA